MSLERWPVRPEWSGWIDAWLTALRAAKRRPSTIESRRQVLAQLSREVSGRPEDLTTEDLLEWMGLEIWDEQLARLRPRWSTERHRTVRAALVGFYRWAHGSGRIDVDPALGLPEVRPAEGVPRPAALEVYLAALDQADEREQLMLMLACEKGLRRAEVAVVHSRDVEDALIKPSLIVHGKGGKQRRVPIDSYLAQQLRDADGYVFPGKVDGHLSPRWVGRRTSTLLGPGTTMHQLRHLFATTLVRRGKRIEVVQQLLGHSSLATTQRYLYVDDDDKRDAVDDVRRHLRESQARSRPPRLPQHRPSGPVEPDTPGRRDEASGRPNDPLQRGSRVYRDPTDRWGEADAKHQSHD